MTPFHLITKYFIASTICFLAVFSQLQEWESGSDSKSPTVSQPATLDSPWRYTLHGWENINHWEETKVELPAATRLHPVVWSACILLAVLMLMICSSSEDQVKKLVSNPQPQPKLKPTRCKGCRKCKNFCIKDWSAKFNSSDIESQATSA